MSLSVKLDRKEIGRILEKPLKSFDYTIHPTILGAKEAEPLLGKRVIGYKLSVDSLCKISNPKGKNFNNVYLQTVEGVLTSINDTCYHKFFISTEEEDFIAIGVRLIEEGLDIEENIDYKGEF